MNQDEFNSAERESKLRMQLIGLEANRKFNEWRDLTEDELVFLNKQPKAQAIIMAEAILRERNT